MGFDVSATLLSHGVDGGGGVKVFRILCLVVSVIKYIREGPKKERKQTCQIYSSIDR